MTKIYLNVVSKNKQHKNEITESEFKDCIINVLKRGLPEEDVKKIRKALKEANRKIKERNKDIDKNLGKYIPSI